MFYTYRLSYKIVLETENINKLTTIFLKIGTFTAISHLAGQIITVYKHNQVQKCEILPLF